MSKYLKPVAREHGGRKQKAIIAISFAYDQSLSMSRSASSPIVLPIVTIQPDFRTVVSEVHSGLLPSETIWVSCYKTECPSVHAKVDVALDEVDRDAVVLEAREGDVQIQHSGVSYHS